MKCRFSGFTALLLTLAMAILLFAPQRMRAQDEPIQNFYSAGLSYSAGASGSQAVAGTAMYAHRMTDAGTYAFTVIDAVPNTIKPFTVNTNIAIGVAQKVATINHLQVYAPLAAGFSMNGTNQGWNWNGGLFVPIPFKGYYIVPSIRFLKSSIGGSGYQPIVSMQFGWGK